MILFWRLCCLKQNTSVVTEWLETLKKKKKGKKPHQLSISCPFLVSLLINLIPITWHSLGYNSRQKEVHLTGFHSLNVSKLALPVLRWAEKVVNPQKTIRGPRRGSGISTLVIQGQNLRPGQGAKLGHPACSPQNHIFEPRPRINISLITSTSNWAWFLSDGAA